MMDDSVSAQTRFGTASVAAASGPARSHGTGAANFGDTLGDVMDTGLAQYAEEAQARKVLKYQQTLADAGLSFEELGRIEAEKKLRQLEVATEKAGSLPDDQAGAKGDMADAAANDAVEDLRKSPAGLGVLVHLMRVAEAAQEDEDLSAVVRKQPE